MIFLVMLIMSVATFFGVIFFVIFLKNSLSTDLAHRMRRHNIKPIVKRDRESAEGLVVQAYRFIKKISKPLTDINLAQSLEYKLNQAGLPLLGGEYVVVNLIVAATVGVLVWVTTFNEQITGAAVAAVPLILWLIVLMRISRRLDALTEQLGDCLITISNALRAGYSFQQTIEVIAKEMEPPIGEEFSKMNHDVSMGVPLEEALDVANKRIGSPDFELVVTAVLIQRDVGGNLAQVLDNISYTIMERARMRREILSLTAQGRLSALVLVALPFVAAGAVYLVTPSQIMMLLDDPLGRMALMGAGAMEVIGYVVLMRIVNIDA